jgi:hypothetical protein
MTLALRAANAGAVVRYRLIESKQAAVLANNHFSIEREEEGEEETERCL